MYKVLAINPGATSTKIGLFHDDQLIEQSNIEYSLEDIQQFEEIKDQKAMRFNDIKQTIKELGVKPNSLDVIVARGGALPPVEAGAIEVNETMTQLLNENPILEHASNLGASLAKELLEEYGHKDSKAYIYDPITVDQLSDVARLSGHAAIERKSIAHMLNMRAVAIKVADEVLKKPYSEAKIIVAHLGGGSTVTMHEKGRITDLVADDEGLFSTERAGGLPVKEVVKLCYDHPKEVVERMLRKEGGFISYCGTNDVRKVEELMQEGDKKATLALEGFAYQIAKSIAQLSIVTNGDVDAIVLTGGIANSKIITEMIEKRVQFLAPVYRVPGEKELEALGNGALRAYAGQEPTHQFEI